MNGVHEETIVELKRETEKARTKMDEMRIAFKALEEGREKELQDISLVYFAKKKALVDRFIALKEKFKGYKEHTE